MKQSKKFVQERKPTKREQGVYLNKAETACAQILREIEVKISRRGYPDFTILKDGEIYGFIEVKPRLDKELKDHQERFKRLCDIYKIPFIRWTPEMGESVIKEFLNI